MKKTQRLTLAEYVSKDSESGDARRGAQALFMEAAGRVCPAFLLHLRDNVLLLLETNALDSERVNQELQTWLQAFHVSEEHWPHP